jgi:hypothetical protein
LAQVLETLDPETFKEAFGHPEWDATMYEEFCSSMTNDTWNIYPLSKGRKFVICKWVKYRTNHVIDASVDRNKAQLVVKVFS